MRQEWVIFEICFETVAKFKKTFFPRYLSTNNDKYSLSVAIEKFVAGFYIFDDH